MVCDTIRIPGGARPVKRFALCGAKHWRKHTLLAAAARLCGKGGRLPRGGTERAVGKEEKRKRTWHMPGPFSLFLFPHSTLRASPRQPPPFSAQPSRCCKQRMFPPVFCAAQRKTLDRPRAAGYSDGIAYHFRRSSGDGRVQRMPQVSIFSWCRNAFGKYRPAWSRR